MSASSSWRSAAAWPVYLLAAAVPCSLALTSVAKLLIFLFGLVMVFTTLRQQPSWLALKRLASPKIILLMLAASALSLLYTSAPVDLALDAWIKHSKLLLVVLIPLVLRHPRQIAIALGIYVVMQSFVVLSSYLLSLGWTLPWVLKAERNAVGTVFTSYLDQSIMTAGLAAICWHLRAQFPGRYGPHIAMAIAALSILNVLLLLPGRSGQVAAIVVVSLAIFWAIKPRWRLAAVFAPILILGLAAFTSTQFKTRFTNVWHELQAYQQKQEVNTSSGERMNYWHRSLQAIQDKPLLGHGVGSWPQQYHRFSGATISQNSVNVRNPHQEYLLWTVEIGVGGALLLLGFLLGVARDAASFAVHQRRALHSMVAIVATVCLFNSSLYDALIGDYFCLMLGLLLAWGLAGKPGEQGVS